MAVWAFNRLADPDAVESQRASHLARETDPDVRREWDSEISA
jgi:hypothetical protein